MKANFLPHLSFILGFLFLAFRPSPAQAQEDNFEDKTLSPYFVVISENPEVDDLPLKETSVSANIAGVIADVSVKQVYVNSGKNTLEAIYTFPLSTKAAVYGMQMTIGTRTITATIEEKQKAREDYEKAKSEGKRASLLEQSRPNVFTMNVTNIAVDDTIIVELKYTELLVPEKGKYSFVYPTVVGPRYSNKSKKSAELDEGFVSTPYTKSGVMPTYKFGYEVNLNSGIPLQDVSSTTHKMNISNPSLYQSVVKLDPSEVSGGNRDVILNYSLQGDKIESGVLLYEHGDENFFLMMVQPPKKVLKEDIPPREYIFIVDVSGSMRGFPLDISKKLLRNLIVNLKPDDKFNVILFSLNTGLFSENSVYATTDNVEKAARYIDQHDGGGNTELLQALEEAYAMPRPDPDLSRTFVVITDGYVDVEKEAFEMIRNNGGDTNFFSFGIGSSVNRYLIEGMAFMGGGEPMIITQEKEAAKQAEQFRSYINTPVLTRIKMNYGKFQAYDVEPVSVPDMLAERPIIIFGKYKGEPTGTITLSGKVGRKNYKQSFDLSKVKPCKDNSAIRYLWARERIKLLDYLVSDNSYSSSGQNNENDIKTITNLGLKYNLMTNYTSFIAIDEQKIMEDGKLVTVKQAVPLPEGVSDYAVGFEMGAVAGMVAAQGISADILARPVTAAMVIEEVEEEEEIYSMADLDTQPEFAGGENAVIQYLKSNLSLESTGKESLSGSITLEFVVEEDGGISDVVVKNSTNTSLNNEIIRIFNQMPQWKPGILDGVAVRSLYTMSIPLAELIK